MATIASPVEGTFSDTGQSNAIVTGGKVLVCLNFDGDGSVTLQGRPEGVTAWFPIKTYTADIVELAGEEMEGNVEYRFDCTDATDDVDYALGG